MSSSPSRIRDQAAKFGDLEQLRRLTRLVAGAARAAYDPVLNDERATDAGNQARKFVNMMG